MGNMMMYALIGIAGAVLYLKGCDLGIKPICKIKAGGGGGGGDGGPSSPDIQVLPGPGGPEVVGPCQGGKLNCARNAAGLMCCHDDSGDGTCGSPGQTEQQIRNLACMIINGNTIQSRGIAVPGGPGSMAPGGGGMGGGGGPGGPMVPMTELMQHIANQAVEDIDSNTYMELGPDLKLNLEATLLAHYKSWLTQIAQYNGQTMQPLRGRALAKYSSLILDVCRRMRIQLNPEATAMYNAQLFAGTPMLGNTTANRVITVS